MPLMTKKQERECLEEIKQLIPFHTLGGLAEQLETTKTNVTAVLKVFGLNYTSANHYFTRDYIKNALAEGKTKFQIREDLGLSKHLLYKYSDLIGYFHFTDDYLEEVKGRVLEVGVSKTAAEYGVHSETVRRFLSKHGYTPYSLLTEYRTTTAKQKRELGWSREQIANLLEISYKYAGRLKL